ncbi:unnamed protein product, partial [marine sediment metagenome]
DYKVPSTEIYYLCGASVCAVGHDDADKDLNQMCRAEVDIEGTIQFHLGGNGGQTASFPETIRVLGDETVTFTCYNESNHQVRLTGTLYGYKI